VQSPQVAAKSFYKVKCILLYWHFCCFKLGKATRNTISRHRLEQRQENQKNETMRKKKGRGTMSEKEEVKEKNK
jgi:hypothetical protein